MGTAMDRQSSPCEPARSSDFMRVESSVTAISWIPSEAISGVTRMPFDMKVGHYDAPPPDRIDPARLDDLRDADLFRFANHLAGTMEVEDGRITSFSQRGSGVLNNTHMRVAAFGLTFQAHAFPDLRPGAGRHADLGDLLADGGWTARHACAAPHPQGKPGARGADGLDDPPAHVARRRAHRGGAGRGHALPPPLGVRPRWRARAEDRHHLVPGVVRAPPGHRRHAVGRGGLAGVRDDGRDVARARDVADAHAARAGRGCAASSPGTSSPEQGEPVEGLFVVLDGMLSVEVDGREVGISGRERSSANGPPSRAAPAPRPSAPSRR